MRLYFGSSVSSKYQATTANELKHSIFNTVVFWLSTFVNIYYCFFNKPVYSCKDTTECKKISQPVRQNNAMFMNEMVSVQNLHALFCCVLEKDSLWHFPLIGVIANRYNHISIKLNTEITNLF